MSRILFNISFILSVLATLAGAYLWGLSYGLACGLIAFVVCLVGVFFIGVVIGRGVRS